MIKNILLSVAASLLIVGNPYAQSTTSDYPRGFRLGLGISGGFDTSSDYNFGLGGDIRLQYDLSRKTSLTLTSGYTHLFTDESDAGFVPIKVGFKAFVNKNLYLMAEAGGAVGTSNFDTSALLSPSIGFANRFIDVSLRYENYLNNSLDQLGLRIAYGFSLKK